MATFALLAVAVGLALLIRFQSPDALAAHVDPEVAQFKDQSGVRLVGDDALLFSVEPEEVLAVFESIALSYQRTSLLAGTPQSGMITFVTRSRAFGFQDYTTARAELTDAGTRLTLAARTRYPGASDWGVNRKRLEHWLGQLTTRLLEVGG